MKTEKFKVQGLNQFAKDVNEFVASVGFDNADVPLRIALIHSEISEAFEAFRKDKFANPAEFRNEINGYTWDDSPVSLKADFEKHMKDTFEDEIADSIIRLIDLCGKLGIDIEYHIQQKMRYNATRGYKYGGKKF